MVTDQRTQPLPQRPPRPALPSTPLRTPAVELRTVLERLVAAADSGQALDAFLYAAGAAQIVADRLQGGSLLPGPSPLLPPRGATGLLARLLETSATAVRGRLGLAEWHVLLRDLANVLAEAVLGDTEEDAAGILLSVRTAVEDLRSGVPPHTARLLDGARLLDESGFREHDLRPEDVVALAERFAALHPDRERPLLVLGLRSSGSYLAPLAAAALGRLEYQHVVARTTRPGGPLLPEEPRLPESLRRVGGLVVLLGAPPRSGAALASVAARFTEAGFAADRIVPAYPEPTERTRPPGLLRDHPAVVLPASAWRIGRLLEPRQLAAAVSELLPLGSELITLEDLADATGGDGVRPGHRRVTFTVRVAGPGGERRSLRLTAGGLPLGPRPVPAPGDLGVQDGVLFTERAERAERAESNERAESADPPMPAEGGG